MDSNSRAGDSGDSNTTSDQRDGENTPLLNGLVVIVVWYGSLFTM